MKTKCHRNRGLYSLCVVIALADILLALRGNVAAHPWISFAIFAIAIFATYRIVAEKGGDASPDGPVISLSTTTIIVIGVVLRFCFWGYPLSDDVNRYAWEGMVQARGVNPYLTAPAKLAKRFKNDPIFRGINHKDVPTAYPPVALLTFRLLSKISYSLFTYKIFFILVDCLMLFLLSRLLAISRLPAIYLIIYAWNPLILLNGAGEGHFDVLHILFFASAFLLFGLARVFRLTKRGKMEGESANSGTSASESVRDSRIFGVSRFQALTAVAFFLLGTAVMTKFLSLVFLPFLINKKNYKYLIFFLIPFLAYIPFAEPGLFYGLMIFSGKMAYNDVIPKWLRMFFAGYAYIFAILAVFGIGFAFIWLFCQDATESVVEVDDIDAGSIHFPFRAMFWAYFWCLLCLPCVHIWYLAPLVVLLVFHPARSGFLLCATIALGFHVMSRQYYGGEWVESSWIWWCTWVPPIALMVLNWRRGQTANPERYSSPKSLDIIIPVHNEEKRIKNHLDSLTTAIASADKDEVTIKVFVVDAASSDDTAEIAAENGDFIDLQIIRSDTKGRGNQITKGFEKGDGEIVLTLHADAIVHPNAISALTSAFQGHPSLTWGILGHGYDNSYLGMSKVRFMNRLRFSLFGIAFGDQGIFARRSAIESRGGMPAIPLMEDVEISLRLAGTPRINVGENLTLSTRRWENRTQLTYALQVIYFIVWYLAARRLGFDIAKVADTMYGKYYGGKTMDMKAGTVKKQPI